MFTKYRLLVLTLALLCANELRAQVKTYPERYFSPFPAPVVRDIEGYVSYTQLVYAQPSQQGQRDSIKWVAPKGTKTDWASIPIFCVPFIGLPDNKRWAEAALVHDAYCGDANKGGASYHRAPWRDVHRMFYYACLNGGTPKAKALLMYSAVYLYGARHKWVYSKGVDKTFVYADINKAELTEEEREAARMDLSGIPDSIKKYQFAQLSAFLKERESQQATSVSVGSLENLLHALAAYQHKGEILNKDGISALYIPGEDEPQQTTNNKARKKRQRQQLNDGKDRGNNR